MRNSRIVISGSKNAALLYDKKALNTIRGPLWSKLDWRFVVIMVTSLLIHGGLMLKIITTSLPPSQTVEIEKMPERFAKLIVGKPLPKKAPQKKIADKSTKKKSKINETEEVTKKASVEKISKERKAAKQRMAQRTKRIEKKLRSVGVIGILAGVGTTAQGPSVIDVLGKTRNKKDRVKDLEQALVNMSGLTQTKDVTVMKRKLIRSKELTVNRKESIDDLVASIGSANTNTLTKRGNFIIQRPESIEGAASANAKRDNNAINKVVTKNKTSIRMSYDKYLKRIPNLTGKITIRFTIAASGKVTQVQILENTTNNRDFERDIIRKVKMWRFEPIPEGDVSVTYPFVFQPS